MMVAGSLVRLRSGPKGGPLRPTRLDPSFGASATIEDVRTTRFTLGSRLAAVRKFNSPVSMDRRGASASRAATTVSMGVRSIRRCDTHIIRREHARERRGDMYHFVRTSDGPCRRRRAL